MTATLRVPRSRGAFSGLLLVLLGLWGALVPILGPYFHFGFAPDKAWDFTAGRVWLQIVPGAAVFLGGLITLGSANRAFAAFGAWLAALGGAWFTVGVPLSALWSTNDIHLGAPLGGTSRQVTEQISLLFGLGVVAVFLAAVALGRLAVIGVRDAALAEDTREAPSEDTVPVRRRPIEPAPTTPAGEPDATDTGPRPRAPWIGRGRTRRASEPATEPTDVKVAGESRRPGTDA
jgi:hypothetical protein